jgi:hypothetical protein
LKIATQVTDIPDGKANHVEVDAKEVSMLHQLVEYLARHQQSMHFGNLGLSETRIKTTN